MTEREREELVGTLARKIGAVIDEKTTDRSVMLESLTIVVGCLFAEYDPATTDDGRRYFIAAAADVERMTRAKLALDAASEEPDDDDLERID